jgi:hypothetical protein
MFKKQWAEFKFFLLIATRDRDVLIIIDVMHSDLPASSWCRADSLPQIFFVIRKCLPFSVGITFASHYALVRSPQSCLTSLSNFAIVVLRACQ